MPPPTAYHHQSQPASINPPLVHQPALVTQPTLKPPPVPHWPVSDKPPLANQPTLTKITTMTTPKTMTNTTTNNTPPPVSSTPIKTNQTEPFWLWCNNVSNVLIVKWLFSKLGWKNNQIYCCPLLQTLMWTAQQQLDLWLFLLQR